MSGEINRMRVGIFLIVGLIFILGSILVLGGNRSFFTSYDTFRTKLNQVQGLNKGSIVTLSGLNVGNISSIDLDEGQTVVVTFQVMSKYSHRITNSTTVEMRTAGALGDKYLYLQPGRADETPLSEGSFVAAAQGRDLIDALTEKGGEATKILLVIEEVLKFSRSLNADGRTERMMGNLAEASESLRGVSQDLRKITSELKNGTPENIRQASQHLNSVMGKIDRGEGTLGALVNDSSLHEQLRSFVGSNPRKKSMKRLVESSIK